MSDLTEGRVSKGGQNLPEEMTKRPPAPQGSGGKQTEEKNTSVDSLSINPYRTVVKEFEQAVAAYSGAEYGIAVDTCTSAIFLSLMYRVESEGPLRCDIRIPDKTYCSVPNAIIHAGGNRIFFDSGYYWGGRYLIEPLQIVDSALCFRRGMYNECRSNALLYCLSFQYRKHIPIGRGGMILTNDPNAAEWLRLARFNGRPERPLDDKDAEPRFPGWLMHMEPERAARGLNFMMHVKDNYPLLSVDYPSLSEMAAYQNYKVSR